MLKVNTGMRLGGLLLGAALIVGLAGPAFAGNVYSWMTEDGTYAYTDDSKRIPSKYRTKAKQRSLGKLSRYERYTEVTDAKQSKPYAERIRERRDNLRTMTTAAPEGALVGALASQGSGIGYTIPVKGGAGRAGRSGASLWTPADGAASADSDDPIVIESRRMDPSDSLATRHWTFVKQGDQIITVIKGERRQRPLKAVSENDFDL